MELLIPTVLWSTNLGLMLGFTFGVLILLQPITRRLAPSAPYLPWPADAQGGHTGTARLPGPGLRSGAGGGSLPGQPAPPAPQRQSRPNPDHHLAGLFVALVAAWLFQDFRLRQIMQRGTVLPQESLSAYDLVPDTAVYLCPGLPTSFARYGAAFSIADERHLICLQKELPPEQMRLVLLHECAHLRLHHAWFKAIMMMVVTLNFAWNPLIWAAYRLTCRDMELACDEAVMEQLSPTDRRNYARALVELGSGRCLWGGTASFSECDTVLRVKRLVNWQPWTPGSNARSLVLTVLLILFFFCGGSPL